VQIPAPPPLCHFTVTIAQFQQDIERLRAEATAAFEQASTAGDLEAARIQFLGDRSGQLKGIQQALGALPKEDKPAAGRAFNDVKLALTTAYESRLRDVARGRVETVMDDPTMPARRPWHGAKHPVTVVIDEIADIFRELGFTIALGPQVETEWYNFGALNFPANHPAMDMHDTLYVSGDVLLRTHTSPVQIRTLQKFPPPIRILVPGDVYRRDFFDASHAPMFAQVEGLCVDEGITFVDLKGMLSNFARRLLGPRTRTRFRPSYFPFTEPSAEMDVECQICKGVGCAVCKGTGWAEILGSGMVHPAVLTNVGVDAEKYTGWAFGMGPGRIAMQRYDIPDIRLLYDSDVRFLEQLGQ
jgi:phenylalanyl-tRNA synthetase alpha chain